MSGGGPALAPARKGGAMVDPTVMFKHYYGL